MEKSEKSTLRKLIEWGCTGTLVLFLCIIVGIAAVAVTDQSSTGQQSAGQQAASARAQPSEAAISSSQPSQNVPTTLNSADAGQYLASMSDKAMMIATAMQNLSDLLQNPKLFDNNWRIMVASQMAVIRIAYQDMTKLQPPPELNEIHSAAVDAAGDCNKAMDYLASGIDNMDTEALGQAQSLIMSCSSKFEHATALVNKFKLRVLHAPTINTGANLRAGPGTNYPRIGGAAKGTTVTVIGRNEAGDWLVIQNPHGDGEVWIAAFLVDNAPPTATLPIHETPPTPSHQ